MKIYPYKTTHKTFSPFDLVFKVAKETLSLLLRKQYFFSCWLALTWLGPPSLARMNFLFLTASFGVSDSLSLDPEKNSPSFISSFLPRRSQTFFLLQNFWQLKSRDSSRREGGAEEKRKTLSLLSLLFPKLPDLLKNKNIPLQTDCICFFNSLFSVSFVLIYWRKLLLSRNCAQEKGVHLSAVTTRFPTLTLL